MYRSSSEILLSFTVDIMCHSVKILMIQCQLKACYDSAACKSLWHVAKDCGRLW